MFYYVLYMYTYFCNYMEYFFAADVSGNDSEYSEDEVDADNDGAIHNEDDSEISGKCAYFFVYFLYC